MSKGPIESGTASAPLSVFVSYAHKDQPLKEVFDENLKVLQRQGLIAAWSDAHLLGGEAYEHAIAEQMNASQILVFLVSNSFLSSDFIQTKEVPLAMELKRAGRAIIVPVVLRDTPGWENEPWALGIHALPSKVKPVDEWETPHRAFADVERELRKMAPGIPRLLADVRRQAQRAGEPLWQALEEMHAPVPTPQLRPSAQRRIPLTLVFAFLAFLVIAGGWWAFFRDSGNTSGTANVEKPMPPAPTPEPERPTPVPPKPTPTPHTPNPAPIPPPPKPTNSSIAAATKDAPFVNTLGMKFVPVPGTKVLFSVWETRVQDYQAFVDAKKLTWEKPKFEQGSTHPAVNMSYEEAVAFCQWLTEKEGLAAKGFAYRLPTDAEWSAAVGLVGENGATPHEKSASRPVDVFPWGKVWPPPPGAGNFGDAAAGKQDLGFAYIDGYDDGFAYTSPAGQFTPNAFGIYDLSGNVWEWCEDWYDAEQKSRVLRGASWIYPERNFLLSSYRRVDRPGVRSDECGFRCVAGSSAP